MPIFPLGVVVRRSRFIIRNMTGEGFVNKSVVRNDGADVGLMNDHNHGAESDSLRAANLQVDTFRRE